ncbi:MAG: Fur family transcriptional regulator [Candidatus Cyclobacteriaceae bacterium M3_2C_046]
MQPEKFIKAHKLSATAIRKDILTIFFEKDYALSHHDIMILLGDDYDRVTVYRTLHKFEDVGILHKINDENGVSRFALCHDCGEEGHNDQHIHFHCQQCGKIFCLDDPTVTSFHLPKGFKLQEFSIDLKGICNNCSPEAN